MTEETLRIKLSEAPAAGCEKCRDKGWGKRIRHTSQFIGTHPQVMICKHCRAVYSPDAIDAA